MPDGRFVGIHPKRVKVEPYSRDRLCSVIAEIREAGGIPMIRTRYAEAPITVDGQRCVLVVGYKAKGKSRWLCNAPERDIMDFESMAGDFKRILPTCPTSIIQRVRQAPPPFT